MILALCGVFVAGYLAGSRVYRSGPSTEIRTETSTDTVTDTVVKPFPVAVDSQRVGYIRIPVPVVVRRNTDTTSYLTQNREKDTVWATIPREQKTYADSDYTAWVSGYKPSLDSIRVYRRSVTVRESVTLPREKPKRFGFGIIGGAGYGVLTRKPDVFVGIGGYIRLFKDN